MSKPNTAVQVFTFADQHNVRLITDENQQPWFVAKDVCDVLEIVNVTQALFRLDDDERSMFNIGRQGDVNIVNESGLYSLILNSRKPEAKKFKKWVTSEVLPSIRKTGAYQTQIPEFASATLQKNPHDVFLKAYKIGEKLFTDRKSRVHYANEQTKQQTGVDIMAEAGIKPATNHPVVEQFWRNCGVLLKDDIALNHSRTHGVLAINLTFAVKTIVSYGLTTASLPELRQHLKNSVSPEFLDCKGVNSKLLNKSVKCFLFNVSDTFYQG